MDLDKTLLLKRSSLRRIILLTVLSVVLSLTVFTLVLALLFIVERVWLNDVMSFSPKCNIFDTEECDFNKGSHVSSPFEFMSLNATTRKMSDWEVASVSITQSILHENATVPNPKIAFMFLTRGPLPFERLWMRFFEGHKGRYSVYVHASDPRYRYTRSALASDIFVDRQIPSQQVSWGSMNMVDAERRILAWALLDLRNQFFILVSESCIPIQSFNYTYNFLLGSQHSFVDCYHDEGEHGIGRYKSGMAPEVPRDEFQKGSQWFGLHRRHALAAVADTLYYMKFVRYCRPEAEHKNCYGDEHYFQTFFHLIDPASITNLTMTFVDWSQRRWHPRTFGRMEVTSETILRMRKSEVLLRWNSIPPSEFECRRNGVRSPCFVIARKFHPSALETLLNFPPSVLGY